MWKDTWHKSRVSTSTQGCVEVKDTNDSVLVRDSKDLSGRMLRFPRAGWAAFRVRVITDAIDANMATIARSPSRASRVRHV